MSYRVKIIRMLLNINEHLMFYPKLAAYYKGQLRTPNPVILDIGANRGQTISFFIRYFPKASVYAFEPNEELINQLAERFTKLPGIVLINKAVSNIDGEQTFYQAVLDETSTLEKLNTESTYLQKKAMILGVNPKEIIKKSYNIETVRLATFIKKMNLEKIDVLKIDVEGHEYKCLKGLSADSFSKINYIQLEYHNDDMYENKVSYTDIEEILLDNGFTLHKRIKHGFGDFYELLFKKL